MYALVPQSSTSALPGIPQYLSRLVNTLRYVLAAVAAKDAANRPALSLLWSYLHRMSVRFDSLLARHRAGRLTARPARPAATRPPAPQPAADPAADPALDAPPRAARLPGRFGWLIRMSPDARQFGGHVRHFLADPEVAALLEASPQARRLLRPLCRMYGIGPEPGLPAALFPPRRPRQRPPRPEPAPRTPRAAAPPWRRPKPNLRSLAMVRVPSANWPKGV